MIKNRKRVDIERSRTYLIPNSQEIIVNVQGRKRFRDRLNMSSVRPPFAAAVEADRAPVTLTFSVKLSLQQIPEFSLISEAEKLDLLTFRY